jgi:hypothetical protein
MTMGRSLPVFGSREKVGNPLSVEKSLVVLYHLFKIISDYRLQSGYALI